MKLRPELLSSMKTYKKTDVLHDLLAGLMVAIIAVPLSIALGIPVTNTHLTLPTT